MSETLYCSFCGKDQHHITDLVAGPSSFICNECIDLCAYIIASNRGKRVLQIRDAKLTQDDARAPNEVVS